MIRGPLSLFVTRISRRFDAFALMSDGRLLFSSSSDPADTGLLPQAILAASSYFPTIAGDVVLLKDPFAGGPGRDGLTLAMRWRDGSDAQPALWAATRLSTPALRALRLPPAPLKLGGEINPGVMDALGANRDDVLALEAELSRAREMLKLNAVSTLFGKKALLESFAREKERMRLVLSELPEGDSAADITLPGGETLKARLHCDGHHLEFDFSGTSPGKNMFLPLAATSGIVWSAAREHLGLPAAIDDSCMETMPLTVPNGCFLNARAGADCDRGLEEGRAWLQLLIEQLLLKWDRRKPRGLMNPFDLRLQLRFGDGRELQLRLPAGSPAQEEVEGSTFWQQRPGSCGLNVERLEREWPLKVLRLDERVSVAGKGKVSGGRGLHLQLELLEDAEMVWASPGPANRVKTEKNQSAFEGADLRTGDGEDLPPFEKRAMKKGQSLVLLSGSGGGLI